MTFDADTYRRQRNTDLARTVDYLEGERARLERLLATVLLMASKTIGQPPTLILEAACTIVGTNPARADIHQ